MSNYFAPSFRIEVNGSRLAADISENIQQLTIVSKPDAIDTFSFTVVNALPKLRWTHTADADLFKEFNAVTISVGYMGRLQKMIEGEITQITPAFPESDVPTVAIEGHARMYRLQGTSKTKTFQKMTDSEIAEQIARDAKLQPEVEDTKVRYDYIMQANQTDLAFLQARAARIGYEILVDGKKLIFRKAKEDSAKVYTLVWAQTQKGFSMDSTFPLKSFTPKMDTQKPATKVEQRSFDPKTKQALVSKADNSDQTSKMGGTTKSSDVSADAGQPPREYVSVNTPFATQEEGDQNAKSTLNKKAMELVGGSAESMGLPDLRSGKVVELKGIGKRFEGLYYVDEATHTISSSGYLTSFTVKRNSVS